MSFPSPKPAPVSLTLRPTELRPHPLRSDDPSNNNVIRLASSIKKYGVLEPLSVRIVSDAQGLSHYEIIDGHLRYRAALLAGLVALPCRLLPPSDPLCAQLALIATLKEQKLHFFDLAEGLQKLAEEHHMTQEEIARYMQLSQSAIANKIRLLRLSGEDRARIKAAKLSERHARALLRLPPDERVATIEEIVRSGANVAKADQIVEEKLIAAPPAPLPCPESLTLVSAVQAPPPTAMRPIQPSKFALRDLRPLYNSIDRALAIFRKTGASASCQRREDEDGTYIIIHIPKFSPP